MSETDATIPDRAGGPRRPTTPLAARLVAEHRLDPRRIAGSGRGGRVLRRDVEALLAADEGATAVLSAVAVPRAPEAAPATSDAPTAWMLIEADLTDLIARIDRDGPPGARPLDAPTLLLAHLARGLALAVGRTPALNAAWAGEGIRQRRALHLAVQTPAGPRVIADAADRSLADLAAALAAPPVAAAPPATLSLTRRPDDAAACWEPALPVGQTAHLAVSGPTPRLTARGATLAVRQIALLGLTFDHRVLDGAPVGRFLGDLRRWLEEAAPATPTA